MSAKISAQILFSTPANSGPRCACAHYEAARRSDLPPAGLISGKSGVVKGLVDCATDFGRS